MNEQSVLVVDDNPLNLELISFVLESEGFVVSTATDAESAKQILQESLPRLLVCDVQLPGISGLDLIRMLRQSDRYNPMTIVVVTSYAMDNDRVTVMDAGCNEYFSKPISTRTFGPQIRALLERTSLSKE